MSTTAHLNTLTPEVLHTLKSEKACMDSRKLQSFAYDQLKYHLAKYGYIPFKHTPGMWHHATRPLTFTLAVDDFGIKYFSRQDANHLLSALEDKYSITIDWSGDSYLALNINWQYDKCYVEISMPDYLHKALAKFKHPPPHLPQHAPHAWTAPVYGQKLNMPLKIIHPSLTKMKPSEFKPFLVPFYIMQGLLNPQSYLLLMKFLISNPNPQRKQPKLSNNSWITYLPILKQSSNTMQVIWSSISYPMLPI